MAFFLWCYVCLFCFASFFASMLSLKPRPFNRPSICRRSDSHSCFFLFVFFLFCLVGHVAFSEYFLYNFRLLFVWRVCRTFFPSGWCFFYLVTMGWIFDDPPKGGSMIIVTPCVCVCVCFLPVHSGNQVRWTYQPGSHRRKVTQDFSSTFFLRYVP